MLKKRGFTLIELLVVIAIIAVLMAILMPSLEKVRRQARGVACASNMHQWGLIFALYCGDNNGNFYSGLVKNTTTGMANGEWWREAMRPLSKDKKMWLCPTAHKSRSENALTTTAPAQSVWDAWRVALDQGGDEGSYAPNGWMCNPPASQSNGVWGRGPSADYWRTHLIKGADNVPVFTGGWWVDGWPRHTDAPPPQGEKLPTLSSDEMQRLCVNRHGGAQFALFADWSARKVALKQLWTLKWNRSFNIAGPFTRAGGMDDADWPKWMVSMKEEF